MGFVGGDVKGRDGAGSGLFCSPCGQPPSLLPGWLPGLPRSAGRGVRGGTQRVQHQHLLQARGGARVRSGLRLV